MSENPVSAPKPPLEVGSKFVGYEIRGLIGQGGHACVFHGYDSFMGQHVAIKVLYRPGGVTKEMMQRGQAEAQLLHRLRHPNIVEVSRAGIEDGLLFIIMELLRGRSLRTILEQEGRLAIEEVLFLSAQIADAAAAAHDQKAIHRDLKPDNVFITADNRVKVLDFGIAKLMDHAAWTTQKNIVLGTMLYMSPEQVQGLSLTPQSDVYALGLIMYTALFGRHPCLIDVQAATFAELTRIQVTRNPPPLDQLDPRIPAHVARLVGRAIAKLPEERPTSMRQFAADIRQSLERYVGEQREQHKILQTRDLSRAEVGSGFRVNLPQPSVLTEATDTLPVSRPAFLGDVSAELAARAAALGPGGTAPLPRDVVLPPNFAPPTPIMAPPTVQPPSAAARPPSTPPVAADTSEYGSPSSRRGPSSADKPTVMSLPGSLRKSITPSTAPPVERQVVAQSKRPNSQPALAATEATIAGRAGVPARTSPLRKAAMAGIALGAVLGIGGGLFLALAKPSAEATAAAPPPIVVESVAPQPTPAPAPPTPAATTSPAVEAAASAEVAKATSPTPPTPPPATPATIAAKPAVATSAKPPAAATGDKMEERLEWLEQDLKPKPAPKPTAKAPTKPRKAAVDVGSGLAF
ncbi:MAG TPA: protein kinase [Polyangiaceae bacterium]|nr:protein kinase [Polyangiaceae bacterium]